MEPTQIFNNYKAFYDQTLYHCPSFEKCLNSCKVVFQPDAGLAGPLGAFIGQDYKQGGVLLVGISANYQKSRENWGEYEKIAFNPKAKTHKETNWNAPYKSNSQEFNWAEGVLFERAFQIMQFLTERQVSWNDIAFTNIIRCSHSYARSYPTVLQHGLCVYHHGWITTDINVLKPSLVICLGELPFEDLKCLYGISDQIHNNRTVLTPRLVFRSDSIKFVRLPHLSSMQSINAQQKQFLEMNICPEFYKPLLPSGVSTFEDLANWSKNEIPDLNVAGIGGNHFLKLLVYRIREEIGS